MSEDLDESFVAAIISGDIESAEKLLSGSGLSNPNTSSSQFSLLRRMRLHDPASGPLRKLVLSQANEKVLTEIFKAAIVRDCVDIVDAIMGERPTFNINASQENGDTFLHIAIRDDTNDNVVLKLCYKVADVNAKNKEGSTPLHLVVMHDNPVIAFHLMDAGANCDMKNSLGRTALHIATINNHADVITQLLGFGADINITCNDNMTPLDYRPNSEILKSHVIARKLLNYYVSNQNLAHIDFDGNDRETFEDYKSEIEDLKTEIIDNSNISYYEFLTCSMNRLAVYAENEELIYAVNLRSWNHPWYDGFIYKRVKIGEKRKNLLSSSLKSLDIAISALFDKVLPDVDLAHAIIDCLSNEDLENLIKAAPSVEDSNS